MPLPTSKSEAGLTPSAASQFAELMRQIHVMKQYCADYGKPMPAAIATLIGEAERMRLSVEASVAERERAEVAAAAEGAAAGVAAGVDIGVAAAAAEARATRAAAHGVIVAGALTAAWAAHSKLCELVAPATPSSIEWTTAPAMSKFGMQRWGFLWGMVAVTVGILAGFLILLYQAADRSRMATARTQSAQVLFDVSKDPAWAAIRSNMPVTDEMLLALRRKAELADGVVERVRSHTGNGGALNGLCTDTKQILEKMVSISKLKGLDAARTEDLKLQDAALVKAELEWAEFIVPDGNSGVLTSVAGSLWPDYFLLVLAGSLGAAFFNLYWAHDYIVSRTFDTAYVQRYAIRLVLGAVSGLVLGHFGGELIETLSKAASNPTITFSRALLALLGGYAVESVNLVLKRASEALASLFTGSMDDVLKAKEEAIKATAEKSKTDLKLMLIGKLQSMRQNFGGPPDDFDQMLRDLRD